MELEIYSEICLDNLAALAARIAKKEVVLDRAAHGGGQIEIDCLIVRRLDVEERLAGMIAGKGGLLLLVHDKEVDVGRVVGRAMQLPGERLEDPMKMRLHRVRRNLKRKRGRRFQAERLLQNRLRGA